MKKRGFTLAELLITLAIIGIAAALIIPLIGRITPDKYKPRVMKYYSEVAKATDEMLSDTGIYYAERDNNGKTTCFGLTCQGTPGVPPYNSSDYSGGVKYKNLLFSYLGIKDGEYKDGSNWSVESDGDDGYIITVDADGGSKGKGCTYNPESCKKPDIFKFKVDKYGKVTPDDSMSRAYFENSENANNRKKDEECAKELYNGAESCSGNSVAGKGDFKDEEAGDGDEEPTCENHGLSDVICCESGKLSLEACCELGIFDGETCNDEPEPEPTPTPPDPNDCSQGDSVSPLCCEREGGTWNPSLVDTGISPCQYPDPCAGGKTDTKSCCEKAGGKWSNNSCEIDTCNGKTDTKECCEKSGFTWTTDGKCDTCNGKTDTKECCEKAGNNWTILSSGFGACQLKDECAGKTNTQACCEKAGKYWVKGNSGTYTCSNESDPCAGGKTDTKTCCEKAGKYWVKSSGIYTCSNESDPCAGGKTDTKTCCERAGKYWVKGNNGTYDCSDEMPRYGHCEGVALSAAGYGHMDARKMKKDNVTLDECKELADELCSHLFSISCHATWDPNDGGARKGFKYEKRW